MSHDLPPAELLHGHGAGNPLKPFLIPVGATLLLTAVGGVLACSEKALKAGAGSALLDFMVGWVAYFVVCSVAALIVSALCGGIGAALGKPFIRWFSRSYLVSAVLFSVLPSVLILVLKDKGAASQSGVATGPKRDAGERTMPSSSDERQYEKRNVASSSLLGPPSKSPRNEIEDMRQAIQGMKEDARTLRSEFLDVEGQPKASDFKFEEPAAPKNTAEKFTAFTRSVMNDAAVIQQEYLADLNKAGSDTLLDPQRLKDGGYGRAKGIISRMRSAVDLAEKKTGELLQSLPTRAAGLNFDPAMEAEVLAGIRRGLDKVLPVVDDVRRLERDSIDQLESLIILLEAGRWEHDGSQYIFERGQGRGPVQ
ncbi:hypothetical protein OVA24_07165 [Luteolibacter sp. SL250]|uniref:hypothetical protein n=1 Tax=Luteolibacter sp. SL250 TaxID=2995170 RepID=UPI0022712D6C|nr:hypothetical protein [Luteolibacter sp. SL250]WAC21161.1 hypothetical protein OVA24_07165 [Luteolibacter sp. SL250]